MEYEITITRKSVKLYSQQFGDIDVNALVRMINFNASRTSEEPCIEDECDTEDKGSSNPVTICGRSIDEVISILNGLDIEKETEIDMTMQNLNLLHKKLVDEINKTNQIHINCVRTSL
jgi:hypothetical protein